MLCCLSNALNTCCIQRRSNVSRFSQHYLVRLDCAGEAGGASSPNGGADLDNADLVSWLNCECFFSLVLVGLLAALPFNLHTQELMQTPETYVARAMELSEEGAFDKVLLLYGVRELSCTHSEACRCQH